MKSDFLVGNLKSFCTSRHLPGRNSRDCGMGVLLNDYQLARACSSGLITHSLYSIDLLLLIHPSQPCLLKPHSSRRPRPQYRTPQTLCRRAVPTLLMPISGYRRHDAEPPLWWLQEESPTSDPPCLQCHLNISEFPPRVGENFWLSIRRFAATCPALYALRPMLTAR